MERAMRREAVHWAMKAGIAVASVRGRVAQTFRYATITHRLLTTAWIGYGLNGRRQRSLLR